MQKSQGLFFLLKFLILSICSLHIYFKKGDCYGNKHSKGLVKKGRYYLSKHRRLELEHFCLQYNEWKKELLALNYLSVCDYQEVKSTSVSDPTTKTAYRALYYEEKIAMVKEAAEKCDYVLQDYIFEAVTTGRTYSYFEATGIPCCRDTFYDRLRKFYYILDGLRA